MERVLRFRLRIGLQQKCLLLRPVLGENQDVVERIESHCDFRTVEVIDSLGTNCNLFTLGFRTTT